MHAGRKCASRELRHSDCIQPRRDRHGLLPVRDAAAVAEVRFFLKQTVRDHLVFRGRRDDELAGGFVVGMVDDRAATGARDPASSG